MTLNEVQTLFTKDGENYLCPVHGDIKGSLSINDSENGVLLHCFAGCEIEAICAKVGITLKDLFHDGYKPKTIYPEYSEALNKKIYGFIYHGSAFDRCHKYQSNSGENFLKLIFKQNGTKSFLWWDLKADKKIEKGKLKSAQIHLYNQADINSSDTVDTVYIVEGEKDADTLKSLGFTAVSHYAGSSGSFKSYSEVFKGKNVYIIYDNDNAGQKGALKTYLSIKQTAENVSILNLSGVWEAAPEKADITDYFQEFGKDKTHEAISKMTIIAKEKIQSDNESINRNLKMYGIMDEDKVTIAGVAFHLEQIGVQVKYNETIRKVEITGLDNLNNNYIDDNFPIIIYNTLHLFYKQCSQNDVQNFLKVIITNNAYNPVLESIERGIWDGINRIPELYYILGINPLDTLSQTLVYKWLWQNLSMLRNYQGEFGADGMLVFTGKQGIGKTSFARKIALNNNWFAEGLDLDVRDKDKVIQAVSCWIGELGEIESTFKSDISALKAFITRAKDTYRVPYGRSAEDLPRRTSFVGTCNSEEYLIDETGNRRFWTVPINKIDLNALEKFDAFQLYLQVDEAAKLDIQGFRLTTGERAELEKRNSNHEKPLKGESEIRDILFMGERDNLLHEEITSTEFKELYPVLRNYSVNQISAALRKIGLENNNNDIIPNQKKKDGKNQKLAILPRPKENYRINTSNF